MASKPIDDSQVKRYLQAADQQAASNQFQEAWSSYQSAYNEAVKLYGYLHPELLPILKKLVEAHLRANNQEYYLKDLVKHMRSILVILERMHGLDSPELIPALEQLAIFYDYDGAHMLAIEVKQRRDDIIERQAALKDS